MDQFFSQFKEDEWIAQNLNIPKNGFFIEIGCGADGVLHSNTKYFEDIGWEGILIEADPASISTIQKHRNAPVLNYAISDKNNTYIDFYVYENKEYSGTLRPNDNKISVKTISLPTLLNSLGNSKHIDLLSIDTEGTEVDILKSMQNIRPSILIVEYNTDQIKNDIESIANILIEYGYIIRKITKCNVIATIIS